MLRTVNGFHLDRVTENGLQITHLHLRLDVQPIPAQAGVRPHREEDVEITGRTSTWPGIALAGHPQTRPGVDTGGNVDAQLLAHLIDTLPPAGRTGIGDHLSSSRAGGAFRHLGEAAERGPCGPAHLACTTTGATGGGTAAGLGTTATAGVAGFQVRNLDFLFLTEDRLLEIDREVVAEVIPLLGTLAPLPTAASAAPRASETLEEGFEQVGKAAHVTHIGCPGGSAQPSLTELVVAGAGLGIAEHLIGPTDLLETVFRSGILVDIGVILPRHAPVSALQRVGIGVSSDPQQVVEISHQACSSPASAAGDSEGPGPMETFTRA